MGATKEERTRFGHALAPIHALVLGRKGRPAQINLFTFDYSAGTFAAHVLKRHDIRSPDTHIQRWPFSLYTMTIFMSMRTLL